MPVPKVDDWGDYLYIVFHVARIEPESDVLELQELDIFLGQNYLVTYHTAPLPILDQDRQNIERDPRDRLRHGADHLLIRFLELAIDQSLAAIEHLDDQVDAIQNAVIENATPEKPSRRSFGSSDRPSSSTRTSVPSARFSTSWPAIPIKPVQPKHRVYFRDLYDHVVRIHDISESLRDLISGTLETYLSVVSNRTNDIMKTLTIVTVMFMPMSFLDGFLRHELLRRKLMLQGPMPRALLFWGTCANHGDISMFYLDLRASPEVVLI